jgi:hypothetical protein
MYDLSLHSKSKVWEPRKDKWHVYTGAMPRECSGTILNVAASSNCNIIAVKKTKYTRVHKDRGFVICSSFHQVITCRGNSKDYLIHALSFSSVFSKSPACHSALRPLVFYHPIILSESLKNGNVATVMNILHWLLKNLTATGQNGESDVASCQMGTGSVADNRIPNIPSKSVLFH